jgi:hypothetical protein
MNENSKREKPQSKSETYDFRSGGKRVQRRLSPRFTGTELRKRLTSFDRAPFTDILSEWMMAAPSPEAVEILAETDPAKYIQALASLARIAGYSDKTETSVDITHNYRVLSDSQIEDRLSSLASQLGLPREKLLGSQVTDLDIIQDTVGVPDTSEDK